MNEQIAMELIAMGSAVLMLVSYITWRCIKDEL